MRIGELAGRTGVSVRSIRHYDENGLLEVERKENGYRAFDESAVGRVLRIKRLIHYGLTVEDIRPLADCLDEPADKEEPCDRLLELYESKLRALDEEIQGLESRRHRLTEILQHLRRRRETEAHNDAWAERRLPVAAGLRESNRE